MPWNACLKIAICDDMAEDISQNAKMTSSVLEEEGIVFEINEYTSGNALLEDIERGKTFHILLLDVMINDVDGIDLATRLRPSTDKDTQIVFISGNREMAMRGYEVSAARYLAKPLAKEKLKEALLYCCRVLRIKKEILIPTIQGKYRTAFSEIQYVEAFDRGTRFVLREESIESNMKFNEAEAMFAEEDFLTCHRAFIVNLAWVQLIRRYEFVLKNGRTVPIGKGRYAETYKRFVNFITR